MILLKGKSDAPQANRCHETVPVALCLNQRTLSIDQTTQQVGLGAAAYLQEMKDLAEPNLLDEVLAGQEVVGAWDRKTAKHVGNGDEKGVENETARESTKLLTALLLSEEIDARSPEQDQQAADVFEMTFKKLIPFRCYGKLPVLVM